MAPQQFGLRDLLFCFCFGLIELLEIFGGVLLEIS